MTATSTAETTRPGGLGARAVATVCLGLAANANIGAPLVFIASGAPGPYWADGLMVSAHIVGLLSLWAYTLANRGEVARASRVVTWATFVGVWVATITSLGGLHAPYVPFSLSVAPLLAGLLLPLRHVVGATAANFLGSLVLGAANVIPMEASVYSAFLISAVGIVSAASSGLRARDQGTIERQAGRLVIQSAEMEAVLGATKDALIAIDAENEVRFANPAARVLNKHLVPGTDLAALGPPFDGALAAIDRGSPLTLAGTDGRMWSCTAGTLPDGTGTLLIMRDVTDEMEQKSDELNELFKEGDAARNDEIDQFKARILQAASNELNTPLTPIRLHLELLRSKERGLLNRNQSRSLDVIERNVGRLTGLVKDILDVARLQNETLRLEQGPVAIDNLIEDEVDTARALAEAAGVSLTVEREGPAWVTGDATRLAQALRNLIANAIKFTPSGGNIKVGLEEDGEIAEVWVADDGPGIAADRRAALFQPFSAAPAHQPAKGGTGLGLFLSKGIIEAHGGTIGHEALEPGSRFWIRLPLLATPEQESV